MADPLDFKATGTEKNLKMQQSYLDVSKDIYDISKKQADLAKKSSQFSRADLAALKAKHKEMETMAKDIQKDLMYRSHSESDRKKIVLQTEDAQRRIDDKSLKQRIARNQMLYKQMKLEADFLEQKAAQRIESENRWGNLAKKIGSENLKINISEYNTAKGIAAELEKFPKLSGAWARALSIVLTVLISAYDLFKKFDKAAWEFRQTIGLTRGDMTSMRSSVEASAVAMMNLGVTINDLYNATKAVGAEMGGIHNVSASIRDNVAAMKAQLGVSEETSAKFLRNMAAIGGKSIISQENTTYMAQSLSSAAGTNLSEIMGDIANASGTTLSLMNRMPNQMLRAAIEARRFNTNINDIARANRTVLDFTTSIQDEMEASVLLGHAINLQRLRELSFAGDIEGSMKERIRLAEKEDFLNIKNVFQKEAIAKALGTSVESLTKQLQANQEIERIRKSGTPREREQLALYEKRLAAKEKEASAEALRVRNEIMSVGNQDRIAQISQKWSQIMARLGEVFLPVIDKVLGFILNHLEYVMGASATMWVLWGKITRTVSTWAPRILQSGGAIRGLTGMVGALAKVVLRFLAPLMFAINIGKEIYKMIKDPKMNAIEGGWEYFAKSILRAVGGVIRALWTTINDLFFGLPGLIMKGLGLLLDMLPDIITKPFKIAWAWLGKWFLGKSPSTLGLMIVEGIASVGKMIYNSLVSPFVKLWGFVIRLIGNLGMRVVSGWVNIGKVIVGGISSVATSIIDGIKGIAPAMFDALTSPFKAGWSWIKKHVPGVEWAATKVSGAGGNIQRPAENKMVGSYIPAATITPEGTKLGGPSPKYTGLATETKTTDTTTLADVVKSNNALLEAINGLRKDLNDGKVSVHMDGALVSTLMARNLDFRGNFGVNK